MITLNYDLIMAIGMDYANRNMRKNGRTQWNEDDWNEAAHITNKLFNKTNKEQS